MMDILQVLSQVSNVPKFPFAAMVVASIRLLFGVADIVLKVLA